MQDHIEIKSEGPIPLSQQMELKVYAIAAITKDIFDREQMAEMKNKLAISLSLAYTDSDAVMSAAHAFKMLGVDPNIFVIPTAIISREVKKIIEQTGHASTLLSPFPGLPVMPEVEKKPEEELTLQASAEKVIASVRFVFDTVGSDAQKKMAEVVIKKFEDHAKTIGSK